jgi:hypothetical protein
MRLVDRHQAQLAALVQRREHGEEARVGHALGRRVQQHQPCAHHLALDAGGLLAGERRVQERGMHAGFLQRADLVVHQRDQRAHHQCEALARAVAHDGRHLIAQALAAAGGHQHQRVAALAHVLDDGLLRAAERRVAEDFLQDLAGRIEGVENRGHGARMVPARRRCACHGWRPDTLRPRADLQSLATILLPGAAASPGRHNRCSIVPF